MLQRDVSFAVLSIAFVLCYFVYHLRSFFLAFVGVSLILLSFGMTGMLCMGMLRVTFYSNLHTLVIFIVLGIAADNIFVLIDAWRQSAYIKEFKGSIHMRMSYSWKRAVRAIAVTSSTTSVAFLANAFSPLMPIRSFGIYAAIIIPVNYALMVFLFPSAIIYYEQKFAHYNVGICCWCAKQDQR